MNTKNAFVGSSIQPTLSALRVSRGDRSHEDGSPPCRRHIRWGWETSADHPPPEVPPCARGDIFMLNAAEGGVGNSFAPAPSPPHSEGATKLVSISLCKCPPWL